MPTKFTRDIAQAWAMARPRLDQADIDAIAAEADAAFKAADPALIQAPIVLDTETPTNDPAQPHELADTAAQRTFITGGHAIFTLLSRRTGTRYTYQITHKPATDRFPANWLVSLLSGPDNTSDYECFGLLDPRSLTVRLTKRTTFTKATKPVAALEYALRHIANGRPAPELAIYHEGRCGRCGRLLTVPESIESGIGPVCAGRED